jgi:hypothetical protein
VEEEIMAVEVANWQLSRGHLRNIPHLIEFSTLAAMNAFRIKGNCEELPKEDDRYAKLDRDHTLMKAICDTGTLAILGKK